MNKYIDAFLILLLIMYVGSAIGHLLATIFNANIIFAFTIDIMVCLLIVTIGSRLCKEIPKKEFE